jgi:hypothetical protein
VGGSGRAARDRDVRDDGVGRVVVMWDMHNRTSEAQARANRSAERVEQ